MDSRPASPAHPASSLPPLSFDPRTGEVWVEMRPGRRATYAAPDSEPPGIRLALADPRGIELLIERIGADLRRQRLSGRTCVPGGSCRIFIDGVRPPVECDDSVRLRVASDDTAVFTFIGDASPVAVESIVLTPCLLRDPLPPGSPEQIARFVHVRREAVREGWDLKPDVHGMYWVAPHPDSPWPGDDAVRGWIAARHETGDPLMADTLAFLAEFGAPEHGRIAALSPTAKAFALPLTATERVLLPLWYREVESGRIRTAEEPDAGIACKLFLEELARLAGETGKEDPVHSGRFDALLEQSRCSDWSPAGAAGLVDPVDARNRARDAMDRLTRRLGSTWFGADTAGFAGWRESLIEWVPVVDTMVPPPDQRGSDAARPE